ncbi:MAG TPA: response regulator transcription factor [Sphingomonas sp.]|nr:response regulator transcription factor [Sphingomonas sp.]
MPILIVEDDDDLGGALVASLARRGMPAELADSLAGARRQMAGASFEAIVLDLGLPDGDGTILLEELRRAHNPIPVIVLTARGAVADRIHGLTMGADDYLPKPFDLEELHARLLAVLRRNSGIVGPAVQVGNVILDRTTREALIDGRSAGMTEREFELFELLATRPGRSISKQQAEQKLFGSEEAVGSSAVEVAMSRLRRRLKDAGAGVEILTVRGIGYVLRPIPA